MERSPPVELLAKLQICGLHFSVFQLPFWGCRVLVKGRVQSQASAWKVASRSPSAGSGPAFGALHGASRSSRCPMWRGERGWRGTDSVTKTKGFNHDWIQKIYLQDSDYILGSYSLGCWKICIPFRDVLDEGKTAGQKWSSVFFVSDPFQSKTAPCSPKNPFKGSTHFSAHCTSLYISLGDSEQTFIGPRFFVVDCQFPVFAL